MADDYIRICPNPRCRLVYRPDPRIYKEPNQYCPKCGQDLSVKPAWKEDSSAALEK